MLGIKKLKMDIKELKYDLRIFNMRLNSLLNYLEVEQETEKSFLGIEKVYTIKLKKCSKCGNEYKETKK